MYEAKWTTVYYLGGVMQNGKKIVPRVAEKKIVQGALGKYLNVCGWGILGDSRMASEKKSNHENLYRVPLQMINGRPLIGFPVLL